MGAPIESTADEVTRLRACLINLERIFAFPALGRCDEPPRIVSTWFEGVLSLLPVDFIFVRLNDWHATPAIQMARVGNAIEGRLGARDVTTALQTLFGDAATHPPGRRLSLKGVEFHITYRTLAGEGELGFVFAGSQRTDFSEQTDASLLDIAVSQLAIRLQHVRDLNEQKKDLSRLATANEELKASERDSRLILDNIPGLVAVLTETGDVESVNRQVFEYFGQNLDELRQWGTNDTVHPEDLPTVIDVFGRSIQSGVPYNIVQRFRRCDGVYRWFQNRGFPLRDTDGRIVLWCVLLSDIDDQKRAEDAVRASERNLKLIIDTMPALAWSARADGSAEFFNQHYLDYLGVSAEQAQDWGWTAALHPDDSQDLAATWQRIMASGRLGEAQARLRRHDGEYRWFLFRANPLRDEQGIIIQWYGVNADIEERRQAEAELRRAYESFADAQRLSRTGNFIADIVADDHKWSAELYRIFEIEPPTEIKLQLVHDMIHPEDVVAFDAGFQRSLGGANFDEVFRIVTSSGNVKHVHAVGHLIERIAGRPLFVGAIQDVTDRKIADEALNRARSELANMTRVATLSALTASIAHEINQPLSGIITNAGTCLRMLERDPPNISGARETARRTIRDGNRASDVITRLRALFSDKDTALEPVELNDATREVITLSLSDLQRNHVILRLDLAEDLPTVVGDRVQLQQVILNLVRNGCDAMVGVSERPRELLIRTERDGDGVRVTVRDAGTGIDRAIVDKLFQPFYSTKPGGMGIGLSLSRSIMERHHGRLWAEANEGPGATFSLFIPQSRES